MRNYHYDYILLKIKDFIEQEIKASIYKNGIKLIDKYIKEGKRIVLISATIEELVMPIGEILGFQKNDILAINTKKENGKITGDILGTLSFKEGKVIRFLEWMEFNDTKFKKEDITFYSDSINDLPLLEYVGKPIATNPCQKLLDIAKKNNWTIVRL